MNNRYTKKNLRHLQVCAICVSLYAAVSIARFAFASLKGREVDFYTHRTEKMLASFSPGTDRKNIWNSLTCYTEEDLRKLGNNRTAAGKAQADAN